MRIYSFETGGNGTYDVQSGLTHPGPKARAISTAVGYNQLLTTNSVSLLAGHGDEFVARCASRPATDRRAQDSMDNKIAHLQRMIAFSRKVPNQWSEHDKLAKTRRRVGHPCGGARSRHRPAAAGAEASELDQFARTQGTQDALTAAELEMMNLTGDGNGFDLVTMPQSLRRTRADLELLPARRL